MAMVIITRSSLTVKAFHPDGGNVFEEYRRILEGGEESIDSVKGNFSDEPNLPDELFHTLESLKESSLQVMDVLTQI